MWQAYNASHDARAAAGGRSKAEKEQAAREVRGSFSSPISRRLTPATLLKTKSTMSTLKRRTRLMCKGHVLRGPSGRRREKAGRLRLEYRASPGAVVWSKLWASGKGYMPFRSNLKYAYARHRFGGSTKKKALKPERKLPTCPRCGANGLVPDQPPARQRTLKARPFVLLRKLRSDSADGRALHSASSAARCRLGCLTICSCTLSF